MFSKTSCCSFAISVSAGFALADSPVDYLNSGNVPPTTLPFSELVVAGDTLYLSGQIGNLPGTLELAKGGTESQSRQVMEIIKTSFDANGYSLEKLVKCTVMLDNISEWLAFNGVYKDYFAEGRFQARAAFSADTPTQRPLSA